MAESKGALIAKTVQKHAGRAKEKVFMVLLFESCEEFNGVGVKTIAVCVVKVACGGSVDLWYYRARDASARRPTYALSTC
ncbi:hypothetical protein RR48_14388 [Papilio machaon]|uniref:Uncharacterized protein n=1 Tax=Papilio machaon TaxID=76193 RepID=A0A194QQY8_PAPMA|nr:hypothetical protein RR48_14388 [Papilio machaon]